MKKVMVLLMVLGVVSLASAAVTGSTLFSDNYDRPNNTNISASSVGMSGSDAPMTYVEAFEGSGQPASIQILNNQLNVAVGAGMSSLFLDHNFTDAAILAADGFSVSMEVTSITTADDTGNRFGGFGVGMTRAEALAAGDSFDSAAPFRPNLARANQGSGVSDFYVDLALDQNLRVWSNGNLLNTINVGAAVGTIRADFLFADFNAGSKVTAVIYFNGVQQDVRTFTWDNTDNNYIGISGRTAGAGVFLDNLNITTVFENKANTPAPIDGATLVNVSELELSWYKGKDGTGNPNPAITQHYLYITDVVTNDEPNFLNISPITVADTADPVTDSSYMFASDTLYYWRVDESIDGSSASDPNTITGYVWSFDTFTFPIIDTDPARAIAAPGGTAVLTCDFTSVTTPTVKWFKSGTPDVELTAGGDVTVDVTNTTGTAYTATLTIENVEAADEGLYYCTIENASGSENAVVSSAAGLGVKRNVAHWTLDLADLQGGQYVDVSGEGHNADPNIVPTAASFVEGPKLAANAALDLTVQPLAAANAGTWSPYEFTEQLTLSLWCKWNGANTFYQGLVTKRDFDNANLTSWYWEVGPLGGMSFSAAGGPTMSLPAPAMETGVWTHLAVTVGHNGSILYMNGLPVATNASTNLSVTDTPILVGSNNIKSGVLVAPFNGAMDDVRIYNYALTGTQVADLYYNVLELPVCINPNAEDLQFDVAGGGVDGDQPDCLVNLSDFAVFAQTWLNCGLYPVTECP